MKQIWVLVIYLWRELFRSLTGALVIVAALVFYLVAILSVTGGVDRDYYALVIGGFFGIFSLILTLIVADRSFRSSSYLLLYRLTARISLLTAIVVTAILAAGLLEIVVALLSLPRLVTGLTTGMVIDILPVWTSWLALGATIGLHMSELVRRGWSRTLTYAFLTFILFTLNQQQSGIPVGLADRFDWIPILTPDPARWQWAIKAVDLLIWPVSAATRVARTTSYTLLESLSPALSLLVAIAFLGLAARLFNNKDLIFPD
jgi:hypothetical protein